MKVLSSLEYTGKWKRLNASRPPYGTSTRNPIRSILLDEHGAPHYPSIRWMTASSLMDGLRIQTATVALCCMHIPLHILATGFQHSLDEKVVGGVDST